MRLRVSFQYISMQNAIGKNSVLLSIGETTRDVVDPWVFNHEAQYRRERAWKRAFIGAVAVALIAAFLWRVAPSIPFLP